MLVKISQKEKGNKYESVGWGDHTGSGFCGFAAAIGRDQKESQCCPYRPPLDENYWFFSLE